MPIPTRRGDRGGKSRHDRALIRKTSLLRDRSDVTCGQARDDKHRDPSHDLAVDRRVLMLEIARRTRFSSRPQLGAISSSRCQKTHASHPRCVRTVASGRTFQSNCRPAGGARRDRTDDLLLAKQALSQLSYGPAARNASCSVEKAARAGKWWAWEDSNFRPHAYQARALTN